tara:strand:- start:13400 stop:13777 length:378 start_codon:yes stop_codon:yes gene_type:complete
MPIEKKEKAVYDNKLHELYEKTQAPEGMTNKNVRNLQKQLQYYYPDVGKGKQLGMYDRETIAAVNDFYKTHFWTEERRLEKAKEMYGEEYVMKSEMQQMQEYFAKQDSSKQDSIKQAKSKKDSSY